MNNKYRKIKQQGFFLKKSRFGRESVNYSWKNAWKTSKMHFSVQISA
jgi:hypothetical protein